MVFENLVLNAPLNFLSTILVFLGLINITRRFSQKESSPELFICTFFGVFGTTKRRSRLKF